MLKLVVKPVKDVTGMIGIPSLINFQVQANDADFCLRLTYFTLRKNGYLRRREPRHIIPSMVQFSAALVRRRRPRPRPPSMHRLQKRNQGLRIIKFDFQLQDQINILA